MFLVEVNRRMGYMIIWKLGEPRRAYGPCDVEEGESFLKSNGFRPDIEKPHLFYAELVDTSLKGTTGMFQDGLPEGVPVHACS